MTQIKNLVNADGILELNPQIKEFLNQTKNALKGSEKRLFMARTVDLLGKGGQRKAELELGWNRKLIRKGFKEMTSGIVCIDNFQSRGRQPTEHHLPNFLADITEIVKPFCQTDPTFISTNLYSPITAAEVRTRLIEQKGYLDEQLPTRRTISTKLDDLNFKLRKVAKCKPKKKIPETDAIFKNLHHVNKVADEMQGVLRLSIDTKATIDIGPFSRNGRCRTNNKSCDHDFEPEYHLKTFGIHLPEPDENYFFFTLSNVTADFMIDCLEDIWPELQQRFNPHTIVINGDNGPENNSHRRQFINRLVGFALSKQVSVELAYYPPYHSKYNPIERVWGVLENHWNGEILDSIEKTIGFAKTMKWNGKNPIVK